jgi:RimJ/RimL family protein N-acetyltransferase
MEDGVVIREGRVEDAAGIIAFIQEVSMEPGLGVVMEPGEFQNTVEQEEEWIRRLLGEENSVMLVAVTRGGEGEIVGVLDCRGGQRRAMRHETTLGMSVKKEWRDRGVGTMLMERALEWARGSGTVKRVQLEVFTTNARAIHLYEKMGFVVEGVRKRAFRKEGKWIDSIVMAVLV